jgi:cytoskeletal protein CcmA (bactofilin family)
MAIFGKEKDRHDRLTDRDDSRAAMEDPTRKDRDMSEPEPLVPAASGEVNAYLGKGSKVAGKLTFEGTVRVDGQVEGEVAAQDTLIVGETAVVNAQILGSTIIIKGKVTGDITARKRVEIKAPGKLFGNVTTPCLIIQEGVIFEGHCSMGGADAGKNKVVTPFSKDERVADGLVPKAVHSEAIK